MLGFDNKKKSPIESIFDAYKIGGFPLSLLLLGSICILAGIGLPNSGLVNKDVFASSVALWLGGAIVLSSAFVWSVSHLQRTKFQIEVLKFIGNISSEAAKISTDGANFKVAMENITSELPKLIQAFGTVSDNSNNKIT